MAIQTSVYLEVGRKKTFAMALDWPGWGRSGKNADEALSRLADYAERYAKIVKDFSVGMGESLHVVETVPGGATTDFGAPGALASADSEPITGAAAARLADRLRATWVAFDRAVADSPAELRKGPRGGGRDRDKMADHVLEAEVSYARKLGVKHRVPALDDKIAIEAIRNDILGVIAAGSDGTPRVPGGWPIPYVARRIAWHVLDHVWEMEDRRE